MISTPGYLIAEIQGGPDRPWALAGWLAGWAGLICPDYVDAWQQTLDCHQDVDIGVLHDVDDANVIEYDYWGHLVFLKLKLSVSWLIPKQYSYESQFW